MSNKLQYVIRRYAVADWSVRVVGEIHRGRSRERPFRPVYIFNEKKYYNILIVYNKSYAKLLICNYKQ